MNIYWFIILKKLIEMLNHRGDDGHVDGESVDDNYIDVNWYCDSST